MIIIRITDATIPLIILVFKKSPPLSEGLPGI